MPLDRSDPSAGTIDIAYALLPHTDRTRPSLGTILPNPGGPGSPAIAEAATWSKLIGPLRKRRDVLLIDPRGTGQSGALACPSLAAQDLSTLDLHGIATTCGRDLGPRAGYFGSAAIADDFAAVRSAGHRQGRPLGRVVGDVSDAGLRCPVSGKRPVDRAQRRPADRVRSVGT